MAHTPDDRARIGVIGTGWWTTFAHLPSLVAYPAAELVALADRDERALNQAGDAFGVSARYTDVQAMLEQERLDGVVIATPHATHFQLARDALGHGLGVMLEKPMVLRATEAGELVRLAAKRNAPLIIGYPYHFVAAYQRLRDEIAAGRLGEIQLVHGLFASMVLAYYQGNPDAYEEVFGWEVTGPSAATYSDPNIAGGGQGQTQVTHAAALLFWLTGLEPSEVGAMMENFDLDVDLCDAITVRFGNRAVGTLASTGGIPARQSAHQQLEYRLYGTEGYALLDAMAGTCAVHTNDGQVEQFAPVPAEERYPKEATSRHLVDVLLGREENRSPGALGQRVVQLLEAAYRSAAEHRFVRIDEL